MEFKNFQNIHEMFRETVDRQPGRTAVKWFSESGETKSLNWKEFYEQSVMISKSLMALDIKKDDKVNIISYTCFKWTAADLGITNIGAWTVGIYHSNLAKDCKYIINHSDAALIFAEDEIQLKKLLEIRNEIPKIRKVILFKGVYKDEWVMGFDEFLGIGKDVSDAEFYKRVEEVMPHDAAGIVYTSGTTGVPKGAMLTHDNITFTAQSVKGCGEFRDGDETFLFLPLAHVFARICFYTALHVGFAITFNRSMETLADDLKAARPHWFVSAPRIFEKIYSKIVSKAEAKVGAALKIFRWACNTGSQVSNCKLNKQPVPFFLNLQYKLAEKLVFSRIHEALGGRLRWCISGAAPLNPEIAKFFHAAGVLILEGIGMTENTSFSNVNRVDNFCFGRVGPPGPGIEQKIAEDGEIMFKGRNIMKGYYKMPEETSLTITEDGWLYTGDLGEIDSENSLRITGRKKELIITSGGKNISPALIEGIISESKYISQVCVLGDKKKYLTALVTLDPENTADYAARNDISFSSIDDLIENEKIKDLVNSEIAKKNKEFASFETVKKAAIVPEFTIENGMLTPTFKIKKPVAYETYKEEIEAMYAER